MVYLVWRVGPRDSEWSQGWLPEEMKMIPVTFGAHNRTHSLGVVHPESKGGSS